MEDFVIRGGQRSGIDDALANWIRLKIPPHTSEEGFSQRDSCGSEVARQHPPGRPRFFVNVKYQLGGGLS